MSVCVQPVELADGDRTWTVLGADHRQVGPVEEFLEYHRVTGSSPHTVRAYAKALQLWWRYLELDGPAAAVQLQVPPPQLQRLGISPDRVRRRAGDPVILQELLHRPHLPVVCPQHGPGPVPAWQLDRLHADAHPPPLQTLP